MPKEIIQTERIDGDNQVVIGWGKGLDMVQIGVQEHDALPGERETGHFTTLSREQIRHIIATLRKAERQAYSQPRPEPTIAVVAYVLPTAEDWINEQKDPSPYFAVSPLSVRRIDGRKITGLVDLRTESELPSEGMRFYDKDLTAIIRRQIARFAE